MIVDSGGKSLHSWFPALGMTEEFLAKFCRYVVALGADDVTKTASQLFRMPGGMRENAKTQDIIPCQLSQADATGASPRGSRQPGTRDGVFDQQSLLERRQCGQSVSLSVASLDLVHKFRLRRRNQG